MLTADTLYPLPQQSTPKNSKVGQRRRFGHGINDGLPDQLVSVELASSALNSAAVVPYGPFPLTGGDDGGDVCVQAFKPTTMVCEDVLKFAQ